MGQTLYRTCPAFREALEECERMFEKPAPDIPDSDHVWRNGRSPGASDDLYPACTFAIAYALCRLWQSWGITPDVLIGHSVGEYAAACIAGIFSLEEAFSLTMERARLMQQLISDGTMRIVFAPEDQVRDILLSYDRDAVSIAAVNGPALTVISGDRQLIERISATFAERNIGTKALQVSQAFHSPLMRPLLAGFEEKLNHISWHKARIKIISNLTGNADTGQMSQPEYWSRHILDPVLFYKGMQALQEEQCEVWIEIGPANALLAMSKQMTSEELQPLALPSMLKARPEEETILKALGQLYTYGVEINWTAVYKDRSLNKIALPLYAFQRGKALAGKLCPVCSGSNRQRNIQH